MKCKSESCQQELDKMIYVVVPEIGNYCLRCFEIIKEYYGY